MDQYRVTREVPLPYVLPEELEDDVASTRTSDRWSIRRHRKPPPAVPLPEVTVSAHDQGTP